MTTTRRKQKRWQWPNVYSRVHRSGETGFIVDLGGGQEVEFKRRFVVGRVNWTNSLVQIMAFVAAQK